MTIFQFPICLSPKTSLMTAKAQIASSVPLRSLRESSPKGCLRGSFSDKQVPKSQIASSVFIRCFQRIISPNPKSQFQRIKSPKIFSENQAPKFQIARGVPITLFKESSLQISNRMGCLLRFSEFQVSKSQIARGVPLRFFQRIKFPNLKSQGGFPPRFSRRIKSSNLTSQGVPLRIFQRIISTVSSHFLVLLYFGGRRRPNIISLRFR